MSNPATIPDSLVGGLRRYREDHIRTGGFLQAVLEGDVEGAKARADMQNAERIDEIFAYCRAELPAESWGSPERVQTWIEKGLG